MIGIFDSGVGGLSVLLELKKLAPKIPFLYFADNAHVPYGEKSAEFILRRSFLISEYLLAQGATSLLIACNTATAVAAQALRDKFSVPVIAVEPSVKPAVAQSRNRSVAVIATRVTLESERYKNLLSVHSDGVRVIERESNDLVSFVENGQINAPECQQLLAQVVEGFMSEGVDTVVLGSTHFYFLADSISSLSKSRITSLSPSEPSAKQAFKVLTENALPLEGNSSGFVVSGDTNGFNLSLLRLFSGEYSECRNVAI